MARRILVFLLVFIQLGLQLEIQRSFYSGAGAAFAGGSNTPTPKELLYVSFFYPDLSDLSSRYAEVEDEYSPFVIFFSSYEPFFKDYSARQKTNFDEWVAYIKEVSKGKHSITYDDVDKIIYQAHETYFEAIRQAIENNAPAAINDGGFEKYFLATKDIELLEYLIFMREAETFLSHADGSWEYTPPDTDATFAMAQKAETGMETASTESLRLRYAFQAMRFHRARQDYESCANIYKAYVEPLETTSDVKNWCLSYYAGCTGSVADFARVFVSCDRYRNQAFLSIYYQLADNRRYSAETSRTHEIIESTKSMQDPDERNLVLLMGAYCNPTSEIFTTLLENMAKGETYLPDAEVVLSHAVNTFESTLFELPSPWHSVNRDWYSVMQQDMTRLTTEYLNIVAYEQKKIALERLAELEKHCLAMIDAPIKNKATWATGAAYLAYLRRDPATALERVAVAKTLAPSPKVAEQLRLTELLARTSSSGLDERTESYILEELKYFVSHCSILQLKEGRITSRVPIIADVNQRQEALLNKAAKFTEPESGEPQGESLEIAGESATRQLPSPLPSVWYDHALLFYLRDILAPRYIEVGRDEMQPLVVNLSKPLQCSFLWHRGNVNAYTQIAANSLNDLPPKYFTKLRDIIKNPRTEYEKLLVDSADDTWKDDNYLRSIEAGQYLMLLDFAKAGELMPFDHKNPGPDVSLSGYTFIEPSAWDDAHNPPVAALQLKTETEDLQGLEENDLPLELRSPVMLDEAFIAFLKLHALLPAPLHPFTDDNPSAEELKKQIKRLEDINSPRFFLYDNPSAFAAQMQELSELGKEKGELGARALYMYGKGLYNTGRGTGGRSSTWDQDERGDDFLALANHMREKNGRSFFQVPFVPYEDDREKLREALVNEYYLNTTARKALRMAAQKTSDPELAARALFMVALARQVEDRTADRNSFNSDAPSNTTPDPFEELHEKYSDTEFYKLSFDTCRLLRDFVSQKQEKKP